MEQQVRQKLKFNIFKKDRVLSARCAAAVTLTLARIDSTSLSAITVAHVK
jgi:hypothetical protein